MMRAKLLLIGLALVTALATVVSPLSAHRYYYRHHRRVVYTYHRYTYRPRVVYYRYRPRLAYHTRTVYRTRVVYVNYRPHHRLTKRKVAIEGAKIAGPTLLKLALTGGA